MTLDEWTAQHKAEGTWDEIAARRAAREKEFAELGTRLQTEQAPLLADLAAVGWKVRSVSDFVDGSARAEAVPVLLKHLLLPYSDRVREGIARAFADSC
jgi:uncharacterized protein (DUF1778 family)